MKFYDCKTAPSPRRVRIFIAEKKLSVETVEVDLKNGEQLTPEFRAINPNCTVPVLVLDDGTKLTSTAGIRHYLEAMYPKVPLMGKTAEEKGIIADLQWRIEMEGLMAMSEALRNSAARMTGRALTGPYDYEQIRDLAERGKLRVQRFLDGVDSMIGERQYLVGDQFSVADIDLLVVVDFASWLKLELPENAEHARRWYDSVTQRTSTKL
ncbi:MAG: glutathione S-transferase [Rhodospirillaceae bacterium]|nr:glutathione S-transferase [Rhodospirillaceae bacterium]|tara:strand:- start:1007 stop:1636 length:630 start_codon:yes stop_codon:yes gene_type:complete